MKNQIGFQMNDLQDAVERLTKLKDARGTKALYAVYGVDIDDMEDDEWFDFPEAVAKDYATLGKAYLDEHPVNENEPITLEWVDEFSNFLRLGSKLRRIFVYSHLIDLEFDDNGNISVILDKFETRIKTRGQLLRLIKVLKGE